MLKKWFCLLAVLLLTAVVAFGQTETGQISGTVKDSSGAVVPGATVTATNIATGAVRSVVTSPAGIYTIPALKPSTYNVVVEAKGFKKYEKKVQVAISADVDVTAQLTIGGSSEVVEVSAAAGSVAVNTENQTVSTNVSAIELDALPTSPDHNPYSLVGLSANVTEDTSSNRGAGFSINGQRSSSTSLLLDGAENVDYFTATVGTKVPLDAVQEFSVLTNNYGAEYGRASGGVVNVLTKSGTNELHGSVYEYNRVSALSSNTVFNNENDISKSVFTRNNFGFSLGGPIKKNKLFFFENFEWLRVRSAASATAAILDPNSYGLLSPISKAYFTAYDKGLMPGTKNLGSQPCSTSQDAGGNFLPGNSLTCDVISYKVPADAGGGLPENTWNQVAKLDWTVGPKTNASFRYASYKEMDFEGTIDASPYVGYNSGQLVMNHNFTANVTHVFSTNLVNATKLVFSRLENAQPLGSAPISPTLYTTSAVPNLPDSGQILQFPGYNQTAPGLSIPFGGPQNLYQIYNDLSITKGRHNIKVGGQFIQIRDNRTYGAYDNAVEYLAKAGAGGYDTALTNLINGSLYQFQGAIYPQGKYPCVASLTDGSLIQTPDCTVNLPVSQPSFARNYRYNDMAFYGSDSWKVTSRFTLNAGLRWEYYGVQHNANPDMDSNFVFGSGSNVFEQIRNGQVKLAKDGGVFWKPFYGGFGPRIGFAWDVMGNGKTSLTGGYSVNYERNFGNVTFNAIQNPPNYAVISLTAGTDIASMPVYTDNMGPMAGTGSKALPAVSQRAIDQNMKPAYAETWNFGVEHQVANGAVATIRYTGSHGVHLYDIANINPDYEGGYLGDARVKNRINPQYSNMNYRSDHGFSHYNALITEFRANNLKHTGVTLDASYTWSHSLDNSSSTFSDAAGQSQSGLYQLGYLDAFNPKLNFGNSDFDIRQRFIASVNWAIPFADKAQNKFVRNALGGWNVGTIFNIRSGAPFSIFDGTGSTSFGIYPLYVGPGSLTVHESGSNYIALPNDPSLIQRDPTLPNYNYSGVIGAGNTSAYPICAGLLHTNCVYTTNGSAYPDRNQFYGPKYWNGDLQISKNVKFSERYQMQLRAEMYNFMNHHNNYIQYTDLDITSVATPYISTEKGGIYGSQGAPTDERRSIQLGIRFQF